MLDTISISESIRVDEFEQEYKTRKLIWLFDFPSWVQFDNLPLNVTRYARYWWMTHEQMDWFYATFFKGHKDEAYFPTPTIKYSNAKEVENCKGGIDRNIIVPQNTQRQIDTAQRNEDYRYLKSGY